MAEKGTENRRKLAAIQTLLAGKTLHDAQNYTIKGRLVTRYSFSDLRKLEVEYMNRCLAETRTNHFGQIKFVQ